MVGRDGSPAEVLSWSRVAVSGAQHRECRVLPVSSLYSTAVQSARFQSSPRRWICQAQESEDSSPFALPLPLGALVLANVHRLGGFLGKRVRTRLQYIRREESRNTTHRERRGATNLPTLSNSRYVLGCREGKSGGFPCLEKLLPCHDGFVEEVQVSPRLIIRQRLPGSNRGAMAFWKTNGTSSSSIMLFLVPRPQSSTEVSVSATWMRRIRQAPATTVDCKQETLRGGDEQTICML